MGWFGKKLMVNFGDDLSVADFSMTQLAETLLFLVVLLTSLTSFILKFSAAKIYVLLNCPVCQ